MKTKWKLIYRKTETKTIDEIVYNFEYDCYYEYAFGIVFRRIYTIKNLRGVFNSKSKTTHEFLEIAENEFDAVEKSVEYWKMNCDMYIAQSVESVNA